MIPFQEYCIAELKNMHKRQIAKVQNCNGPLKLLDRLYYSWEPFLWILIQRIYILMLADVEILDTSAYSLYGYVMT